MALLLMSSQSAALMPWRPHRLLVARAARPSCQLADPPSDGIGQQRS